MADNTGAARVGSSGKAYVAPLGTVAPVGIETETTIPGPPITHTYAPIVWPTGFVDLGLISDDGLTEALDEKREDFTPWGYLAPVRTQITEETTTFKFTCWETSATVASLRYRVDLTDMSDYNLHEVHFNQVQRTSPDLRTFGFDIIDGTNMFRYVIPRGEVTDRGDVSFKSDEIIGYEFTVTAYPGSDGVSIARYMKAGLDITP